MGFYSPSAIVQDAQRHGVEVRDVCAAVSSWDVTLEPGGAGTTRREGLDLSPERRPIPALRLGLRLVKGLGEAAARRLLTAREGRPFTGLGDLVRRSGLTRAELDRLAEAGAFEALVAGRRQARWQVRAPRTEGLFAALEPNEPSVELPALRPAEQLLLDYGTKGLCVTDHPLRHLRERLQRRGVVPAAQLPCLRRGMRVAVAGLVTCRQRPLTANGVVFITLEDETGLVNLILFRDVYERLRQVARYATILLARGELERDARGEGEEGGVIHVLVHELERLDRASGALRAPSRDFH
jgi:error-prone DNA polymerase